MTTTINTTIDTTDDLFSHIRHATHLQPRRYHVACAVCELPTQVLLTDPKLCAHCAADPAKAQAQLDGLLADAEWCLAAAEQRASVAYAQADDADQARYDRTFQAMLDPQSLGGRRKVEQALAKARSAGDGLSAILTAYDAAHVATDALEQARIRHLNGSASLAGLGEVSYGRE